MTIELRDLNQQCSIMGYGIDYNIGIIYIVHLYGNMSAELFRIVQTTYRYLKTTLDGLNITWHPLSKCARYYYFKTKR